MGRSKTKELRKSGPEGATLITPRAVALAENGGSAALENFLAHCHIRRVPARNVIIHSGRSGDTLYYVVRGSVSVNAVTSDGRDMVLAYLGSGDFFGEMGLFLDGVRSAEVVARRECELAEMSYTAFLQFSAAHPDILFVLASQVSRRLYTTNRKLMDLAFIGVAGRVAQALLDVARQADAVTHPQGKQIKITRQEIARIVGCSREMAGRVLKELQSEGLIHAHGKTVVVFDVLGGPCFRRTAP